jgi:hypothetical protein
MSLSRIEHLEAQKMVRGVNYPIKQKHIFLLLIWGHPVFLTLYKWSGKHEIERPACLFDWFDVLGPAHAPILVIQLSYMTKWKIHSFKISTLQKCTVMTVCWKQSLCCVGSMHVHVRWFQDPKEPETMDENGLTKKIRKIWNTPQQVTSSGHQKSWKYRLAMFLKAFFKQ